ncbi:LysR family transcriptional regulator [Ovoidimarina sediminis]|uniref:LysR family transcriptional regulator n=1 Tax=Ovoidimarina sediminis TaxID=3079856 RepID=UPI00290ECCAD|nr:LysR family transcriptional regulator [Rhodophyticola sp. MJ-SS7]MDU8945274.1 LysR family transcriptional regulator [Rhodophyticola sp. MJ-SS7]
MDPSLRQIRYFIAAANAGQISRAARDLNVSQSAITTAIRQLEDIVGCPLFRRHVRGVSLTHDGTIFLQHAHRIFATVDEAVHAPRSVRTTLTGKLRIAMTYTVAGYYLPPHLERFTRYYPGIELQPVEASRTDIESGLQSGQYDIAVLLTSNIADQEALAYETLIRSSRRLWLGTRHGFLERESISLADVATQAYIMLTVDEASNTAQRYWNQAGVRPKTLMRTSSVEAVRSMVASGMGVTILSDMVYRPWSLEGLRVEAVDLASPVPTMDVGLAWAVNVDLPPAAKTFREFMRTSGDTHRSSF